MTDQPNGAPPHFIVLVPGYMGSKLRDRETKEIVWLDAPALVKKTLLKPGALDEWFEKMLYPNDNLEPAGIVDQIVFVSPLFKQEHYGRLLEKLEGLGYRVDPQWDADTGGAVGAPAVYTFAYDWRQDNRISARQLGQAIQGWQGRHPGAKAWLIAHSNGGIVSRWYIEKEGGAAHVERLFLMGSPWDGAPKSLQVLLKGLDVMFIDLLDRFTDISQRTREIMLSFPSYYQLIPSFNTFLRDPDEQIVDPFADLRWLDNDRQRQMLLDAQSFNHDMGNKLSVDTLCFFGVKQETTVGGIVPIDAGGRYGEIEWDRTEAGDGTVPQRSAVNPNAREKLPYAVGHGDIYIDDAVLEKLEWELVTKYRLGVLAKAVTANLQIQFEPDRDVYSPGEAIHAWATVAQRETGAPVFTAQVDVRLEWRQALPGLDYEQLGFALPDELPAIRLEKSTKAAGSYLGSLTAPSTPGYYRLVATVKVEGEEPVKLQELILVEGDVELEQFQPSIWDEIEAGSGRPPRTWASKLSDTDGGFDEAFPRRGWGDDKSPGEETPFDGPPVPLTGPPPDISPTPEPKKRFLNAEVTEHDMDQPLPLDQEFTLAFYVDLEAGRAAARFDDARLFASREERVHLSVHLASADFIVHTKTPQELRVPGLGKSRNKARFDLEPKREGIGEVTALFYKENNFIQGMVLKLNVAHGQGAFAGKPETLGRPVEGMVTLQKRGVSLFIRNTGAAFDLTMVGAVAAQAQLRLTLADLDQKITRARRTLEEIVFLAKTAGGGVYVHPQDEDVTDDIDLVYQSGLKIPEDVGQEALKRLARAGFMLYREIFYPPNASADLKHMGDKLRELAQKNTLKLQIVSQEFVLPWGMLYVAEKLDPNHIDPQAFLGLRHIIEHIPLQREMAVLDPNIPSDQPKLSVSLNVDASIDASMGLTSIQEQRAFWDRFEHDGMVKLSVRESAGELLNALQDDKTSDQILYFYGHATSQKFGGGPADSALLFADQSDPLTLEDLTLFTSTAGRLPGAPLVFINACESAELSPLFYNGFMPYFTDRGARGMIGTECKMPARFATAWAGRFFERFLSGEKSLGEIFLELRREFFFGPEKNLLGLLYALYCDGDTRVVPGI